MPLSQFMPTARKLFVLTIAFLVVSLGTLVCLAQLRRRATETGSSVSLQHDGREREYRIHVPDSMKANEPVPLVLCFHGGGGNSSNGSAMGLTKVADREGFIAVYPNAINKHWNDGRNSPRFSEHDKTIDDVAFVMSVIDHVSGRHSIDHDRIFAVGLSNGGFLSQRLAMERSEVFAGVGIIVASMGEPISKTFAPENPVSILYFNGTEDPLVPYEGGPVGEGLLNRFQSIEDAPRGRAIATDAAVALWVKRNQVSVDPKIELLEDIVKSDGSHVEYSLWDDGEQGTAVALYKVIGGGHGLPGGRQYFPERVIGRVNQDVKGFDHIWNFFENHARNPANANAVADSKSTSPSKSEDAKVESVLVSPSLVFPDTPWETVNAAEVGLDPDAIQAALDFAMKRKSSSVVISVGGKILAQRHKTVASPSVAYRRTIHGETKAGHLIEDVASVQKSVTSVLVGIGLSKNLFRLDDSVQKYLGQGWSNANSPQEARITLRHLITMTTGLDSSLNYVAPPGTRWKYNTTSYQKTMDVVANAAEISRNELTRDWLTEPLGMNDSRWVPRRESSQAFLSSALDLNRLGILMLGHGRWNDQTIVDDRDYLDEATEPSQELNPAYGYLWWLNGQEFALRPILGRTEGPRIKAAPSDLFAAEGRLGRKLHVVPSMKLVVSRLGDNPEVRGEPAFDETFWGLLMKAFH